MTKHIDHKRLIEFSKGKYSYNDYLQVKQWLNEWEEKGEIKEHLFDHWKELQNDSAGSGQSLQHIFEKIQYSILLEEKKSVRKSVVWNFYRQAAAILLIPMLAFMLWYSVSSKKTGTTDSLSMAQSWVEINAPEGSRVEFFLPYSTSGWLNGGSKLKYPVVFSQHRKVQLTGEAYFEVKQLAKSDFVVSVPDLDVKVLGTKFNVSAYPDDAVTDVVLNEGKVEIEGKAGVFNQTLSPNEKITFNRDKKSLKMSEVEADRFSAWKDGYLIIDNEPLGQVAGRIERWYNAEIVIQDEALKNYRFKATFKDEPLEEVLRLIAITTPVRYEIEKRNADANGVLKQKKVILKLQSLVSH